jgi:hypothetical protein
MVLHFLRSLLSPLHHVVIFGRHSEDWMSALGPKGDVWYQLPLPNRPVVSILEDVRESRTYPRNTVVIPLLESHTATWLQRGNPLLGTCLPSLPTLHTFGNKAAFAKYAAANRLSHHCPTQYHLPDLAEFPCVLKRTDLNAGAGVVYVSSKGELLTYLQHPQWLNHEVVMQQHIEADVEYTCHGICHNGALMWHAAYRYDLETPTTIRSAPQTAYRHTLSADQIRILELFLRPVRYSGPVNIDFRTNAQGATKILEINPRLGGSLMRAENQSDLATALTWILRLARPLSTSASIPRVREAIA